MRLVGLDSTKCRFALMQVAFQNSLYCAGSIHDVGVGDSQHFSVDVPLQQAICLTGLHSTRYKCIEAICTSKQLACSLADVSVGDGKHYSVDVP